MIFHCSAQNLVVEDLKQETSFVNKLWLKEESNSVLKEIV